MDSTVAGFFGRRGAGKTLSMTAFAFSFLYSPICLKCNISMRIRQDRGTPVREVRPGDDCPECESTLVCNRQLGWSCVANYGVKFADRYEANLADYISNFPEQIKKTVLLVDEQAAVTHSYRAMSSLNMLFALFVEQLRKRQVHFMYTSQNPNRVDRNVFWQTDVAFACNSSAKGHSVKLEAYDQWGGWLDNYSQATWPPERDPDRTLYLGRADRFWGMYDTEEIVLPTEWFKQKAKKDKAENQMIFIDPDTPEGQSVRSSIDRIFMDIPRDGVDYSLLVRRFSRQGLPEGNLGVELRGRGYEMIEVGRNKRLVRRVSEGE